MTCVFQRNTSQDEKADMNKIIRTVRFSSIEIQKIEDFLKKNSFLDFSTLARMAINNFIERPTVQIKPLETPKINSQEEAYDRPEL